MALVASSSSVTGGSLEIPGLTKNSTIPVTIDDLSEGFLVVSFAHSDNLYQGVLLELNRERGIPSGISFKKLAAQGNSPTDKVDGNLSPAQPLHQRHSYNPGSFQIASVISQPSLRRMIKPPERFKNARMQLRLRASRPVLCAKCRSLCDEKTDTPNNKKGSSKDDNQTDKGKNKIKQCKPDVHPKIKFNGKLNGADGTEQTTIANEPDPRDLTYESVGSTGIVANYWKRPLVKPLIPSSEETYSRLRKHKAHNSVLRNKRKRMPSLTCINSNTEGSTHPIKLDVHGKPYSKMTEKITAETLVPSIARNNTFVCKPTVCDTDVPNTRGRKELSLKMCITKLTDLRNEKLEMGNTESVIKKDTSMSIAQDNEDRSFRKLSQQTDFPTEKSFLRSTGQDVVRRKVGRPRKKPSKNSSVGVKKVAWGNRIRTNSNVPVRYRDESYLTKKSIFNFNKRRSPINGEEIPVLTITRDENAHSFKVSNPIDHLEQETSTSHHDISQIPVMKVEPSTSTASSFSPTKSDIGSVVNKQDCFSSTFNDKEGTQNIRTKSIISKPPAPEMIKTPTIKITFGTSGNGMVVEIPPKAADLKATKKAMKKAKKEAKRKRSVSPDQAPSLNALSPNLEHSLKVEKSIPTSPTIPFLTSQQDEELCNNIFADDSVSSKIPFMEPHSNDLSSEMIVTKKKKQKKKRRSSKHLKENDTFNGNGNSSNGLDLNGSVSSSVSDSFLNNQDCNNFEVATFSPPAMTALPVKRTGFDSISNPSTPEPMQSFCNDLTSLPPRRRSVPATSTSSSNAKQRVLINLKRVDNNAYVPLPNLNSISCQEKEDMEEMDDQDPFTIENYGVETEDSDPTAFPNSSSNGNELDIGALTFESVEHYKDSATECVYRKGDVVWGKLPSCPWWPGKITDILVYSPDEVRAKISWYKSNTQSSVLFQMVAPFVEHFHTKYAKRRKRGSYQSAVTAAMSEAQQINPANLSSLSNSN